MHLRLQPDRTITRHQTWLDETSCRNAGRAHRDGVVRGLAFVVVMVGVFALLTISGRTARPSDLDTAKTRPVATYAIAVAGRG